MNVLDLFSGIGAFSLGLERAGMRTVAFCEVDPFCRRVLAKHWPEVPCYDDVRTLTADTLVADGIVPDVICGGFPCQDISLAGGGAGLVGEQSGLWSEFARLIGEIRPRYAIVENVAALLGRGLGDVLGDLASLGYDAEWHCIPASAIGFPHERDRIWICAYPTRTRRDQGQRTAQEGRGLLRPWALDCARAWVKATNHHKIRPEFLRVVDGVAHHVDRLDALGNSLVPQIPELIGRAVMAAQVAAA